MPQSPIAVLSREASQHKLDIAADTVIKVGPGYLKAVIAVVGGSVAGALYDSATVAGVAASNKIMDVPTGTTTPIPVDFPFTSGLVYKEGTGQTVNVSFI